VECCSCRAAHALRLLRCPAFRKGWDCQRMSRLCSSHVLLREDLALVPPWARHWPAAPSFYLSRAPVKVSIDWLRKPAYPFAASRLVRSSPCCRMPRGGRLCPVATALLLAGSLLAQAQLHADVSNAELVRRYCAGSSSSAFFRTAPRLTVSATPTRSRSVRTEMLPSRLPPPPGPPVLCSALF